jgi:hypothetical protein
MIRQELFNQFIHSGMLGSEMVRAIALVYTAQRMTNEIQARRADIRMVIDNLEFRVEELIVSNEGDLAVTFYRPEKSAMDYARLYLGDDLSLTMINSWVPDPVEPTEGDDKRDDERRRDNLRSERFDPRDRQACRERVRGRPLKASEYMDQIDIDIIRQIYHVVSAEAVELLRGFWKMVHPVQVPRKHNVNDIVYHLGERDRLEAMFEVRLVRPGGSDSDLDLIHLMTGEPRTTHSSRYGTEQDWLKSLVVRNGRREELIPNDEEREFMEKAKAYVKANDKK